MINCHMKVSFFIGNKINFHMKVSFFIGNKINCHMKVSFFIGYRKQSSLSNILRIGQNVPFLNCAVGGHLFISGLSMEIPISCV